MTGDVRGQLLAAGRAAITGMLATTDTAIGAVVDEIEQRTGERILVRASVLEMRRVDVDRVSLQAHAWLGAVAVLDRWLLPFGDERTFLDVVKVLPPDDLAELRRCLRLYFGA